MKPAGNPDAVSMHDAANGFACISTFSAKKRARLGLLLMFRYGFWRWRVWLPSVSDNASYPAFIRRGMRIETGYDNWSGYDLLATNDASDGFLRAFYVRHCS
jgi:hypothetical protein